MVVDLSRERRTFKVNVNGPFHSSLKANVLVGALKSATSNGRRR